MSKVAQGILVLALLACGARAATPTDTETFTFTPTDTDTDTFTFTPTDTGTDTETPTESPTDTAVPTSTDTPAGTATFSPTVTLTPTNTPPPTNTFTPSPTPTVPKAPTPVAAFPGDARVILQWQVPWSAGNNQDFFNVYRGDVDITPVQTPLVLNHYRTLVPSPRPTSVVNPTPTTFTYVDLTATVVNLRSYSYTVTHQNSTGESPWSLTVTAIPYRPLATAADDRLFAELIGKNVELKWAPAPAGNTAESYALTGYNIYRSADGGTSYGLGPIGSTLSYSAQTFTDMATAFGAYYTYRVAPLDAASHDGQSYQVARIKIPDPANKLLLDHNAFNPEKGERLGVTFTQVQTGHLWIKIYTLRGDYVATLIETDVDQADADHPFLSQRYFWDGRNAGGRTVASGVYHLRLEGPQNHADAKIAVIK